jgi:hypothetical protein
MHVRGQPRGRVLAGQGRRRPAVPARPPWPALPLPAAARMVLCAAAPVRWIFARRLAGHSVARIARALNEAGVPCPSSADPGRNLHRTGAGWTLGTVTTILSNPRYTGRQVWNRQRTDRDLADPADVSLGDKSVQRWNLPDGWVISRKPAHPALVSEADFIAAHDISAARSPAPGASLNAPRERRYLLAGLLVCGGCGRRMESAWSNGKAAPVRTCTRRPLGRYRRIRTFPPPAGKPRCRHDSSGGHGVDRSGSRPRRGALSARGAMPCPRSSAVMLQETSACTPDRRSSTQPTVSPSELRRIARFNSLPSRQARRFPAPACRRRSGLRASPRPGQPSSQRSVRCRGRGRTGGARVRQPSAIGRAHESRQRRSAAARGAASPWELSYRGRWPTSGHRTSMEPPGTKIVCHALASASMLRACLTASSAGRTVRLRQAGSR